ncbi:hypothetical protein FG386_002608 [Cryptosporidium ryanae]|uniref:uncharacterized protein n=1 Tax=Cryptosporidium ryanae TaxID=515981 RepID=UPI00351A0AE6|nr:hypothetical protein FG386_002608 [Cryptosporidium ryanae]
MSKRKKDILNFFDSLYPFNVGLIFEAFSKINAKELRIFKPIWAYDRCKTQFHERKRKKNLGKQYRNRKSYEEIILEYNEFVMYVSENITNFNLRDIGYLPSLNLDIILERMRDNEGDIITKNYYIISILRIHIVSCLGSSISLGEPNKRIQWLINIFNKYNVEMNDLFQYIEYNDLIQLFGTVLKFVSGIEGYLKCKKKTKFVVDILGQCESKIERHFNSIVRFFPEILENDEKFDELNSPIGNVLLPINDEELSPGRFNPLSSLNSFSEEDMISKFNFLTQNQVKFATIQDDGKVCGEYLTDVTINKDLNCYRSLIPYYWCFINSENNLVKSDFEFNSLNLARENFLEVNKWRGCYLLNNLINKDNSFASIVLSFSAKNTNINNLDFPRILKALSLNIGICVKINNGHDIYRHIFSLNINSILDPNKLYLQNKYNGVSVLDLNHYKRLCITTTDPKNSKTLNFNVIWSININDDNKFMFIEICDYLSIHVALNDDIFSESNYNSKSSIHKCENKSKRGGYFNNKNDRVTNNSNSNNTDNKETLFFPTIYLNNEYFDFSANVLLSCPLLYLQHEKIKDETSILSFNTMRGSRTINKMNINTIKRQSGAPKRVTRLRPSGSDTCFTNHTNKININTSFSSLCHPKFGMASHKDDDLFSPTHLTSYTSTNTGRLRSNYKLDKIKTNSRRMKSYSSHNKNMYGKSNIDNLIIASRDGVSLIKEQESKEIRSQTTTKISRRWGHFPTIKSIKKLSQGYNISGKFLADYLNNLTSFIYKRFSI